MNCSLTLVVKFPINGFAQIKHHQNLLGHVILNMLSMGKLPPKFNLHTRKSSLRLH